MSERFSDQEKNNREAPLEAGEAESRLSEPAPGARKPERPLQQSALSDGAEEMADSDESVHALLSDSPKKTSFMLRVSLLLLLYFFLWVGIIVWALYDQRNARIFYRSLYGKVVGWMIVGVLVMLKIVMGLAGRHMRAVVKLVYLLDLLGSAVAIFCLYFFFEQVNEEQYVFNGIYVAIFAATMLGTALGLFLSLGFAPSQTYNPAIGAILMFIMNLAVCAAFYMKWDSVLLRLQKLVGILIAAFFIDLYLAFETRQIIEYRPHKYFETDAALGFFTLWTDWFSFFWIDSLNHTKFMKRRAKKKLADKKAAKAANPQPVVLQDKSRASAVEHKAAVSDKPESTRPLSASIRPSMVEA